MKLALVLALLALMAHAALAQDDARLVIACTPDALALCGHAIARGRGAIVACMKAQQAKLSAECLATIKAGKK